MRRIMAAALTILLLAGVVTSALAATPPDGQTEANFLSQTNAARAAGGLAPLNVASDLVDIARRHSAEMADSNSIYHTANLGDMASGANVRVASGGTPDADSEIGCGLPVSVVARSTVVTVSPGVAKFDCRDRSRT